jgi:hypothetical protein
MFLRYVACFAFRRCWLIESDRFSFDSFYKAVTLITRHSDMPSAKRELRPLLMIKSRRHPPLHDVTVSADCFPLLRNKLSPMRINVACLTRVRCTLELIPRRAGLQLVARSARNRAMSSQQRKRRLRMVESFHSRPRTRDVARLASEDGPVDSPPIHPLLELSMVRIHMAGRAGPVFNMKWHDFVATPSSPNLVTIRAWNRRMPTGQRESRFAVFRNRVRGTVEVRNSMTTLAPVSIRRGGELATVRVFMTVHAVCKFQLIDRRFVHRGVALHTLDGGVLAFKRIF